MRVFIDRWGTRERASSYCGFGNYSVITVVLLTSPNTLYKQHIATTEFETIAKWQQTQKRPRR
jgi:hypothetical protein